LKPFGGFHWQCIGILRRFGAVTGEADYVKRKGPVLNVGPQSSLQTIGKSAIEAWQALLQQDDPEYYDKSRQSGEPIHKFWTPNRKTAETFSSPITDTMMSSGKGAIDKMKDQKPKELQGIGIKDGEGSTKE